MKTKVQQSNELPARERVLAVACEMFAEAGFCGTHIRQICERAGTNVAGVCYHFASKEGLYQAVIMEAGRRLSDCAENFDIPGKVSPQQRLQRLTESLLQRLSAKHAWIAKLLARELVDLSCGAQTCVASGLERDFVLLQTVMRDLLGADASSEAIRIQALSVLGECVFYSLAGENQHHGLSQFAMCFPTRAALARAITQRSLGVLRLESVEAGTRARVSGGELFQTVSGNCT
jgi:AcrR family transcriptional regulator